MEGWRQRRLDSEELIGCAHFSRCCYLIIDLGSHLHLGGSRQKFSPVILDGGLHEVFELVSRWRVTVLTVVSTLASHVQESPVKFAVRWDKVTKVSRTTPTLQVVVNPPLRCGTPVHDNAFQALHDLGADYVRYVPWLPYPHLGVAETLRKLEHRELSPKPQDHAQASLAPILKKEDGRIDWLLSAEQIYARIRGFAPWPGAFTTFRGPLCHLCGRP